MSYIIDQLINTGNRIQTTYVWQPGEIENVDVNSEEFKKLLSRLNEFINIIQLNLNDKINGQHPTEEFLNNKVFPASLSIDPSEPRPAFQKTFMLNALATGTTTIAHGITATGWLMVSVTGGATNTTTGERYPLPFPSASGANNIEITADATNLVIVNNSGVTFTQAVIVLEFLKY